MEVLIYIANSLYLLSYFTQDVLYLRVSTVIATSCLATYFYLRPEPEMTLVGWNLFFIALNLLQLSVIIRKRLHRIGDVKATLEA